MKSLSLHSTAIAYHMDTVNERINYFATHYLPYILLCLVLGGIITWCGYCYRQHKKKEEEARRALLSQYVQNDPIFIDV